MFKPQRRAVIAPLFVLLSFASIGLVVACSSPDSVSTDKDNNLTQTKPATPKKDVAAPSAPPQGVPSGPAPSATGSGRTTAMRVFRVADSANRTRRRPNARTT
jgi:hypothetical protein